MINEVIDQHGRIDALVCNTLRPGLSLETPLERITSAEWDRHMAACPTDPQAPSTGSTRTIRPLPCASIGARAARSM